MAVQARIAYLSSLTSSVVRLGAGYIVRRRQIGPRPKERLELYEFEGCPFCRKVRETLTELDLEAVIYPCPRGGERYRSVPHRPERGRGHARVARHRELPT